MASSHLHQYFGVAFSYPLVAYIASSFFIVVGTFNSPKSKLSWII
jgi:hypothetical protein